MTTKIGSLKNKTMGSIIYPEDRRPKCDKHDIDPEMDAFCKIEIPDTYEGLCLALRYALSNPSPFSLMFVLKYGKVDPNFVVGFKNGKFKKYSAKHFKIPDEVYVPGDVFYEGTSEPNAAYASLYNAYQNTVCRYKGANKLEYKDLSQVDVVTKILDEVITGTKKGKHCPVFVFIDFDMNTIYAVASSDKVNLDDLYFGDCCHFENKKFLSKFATVYLDHNHGNQPEYFSLFSNEVRGRRFIFPHNHFKLWDNGNKPCRMSVCKFFRGYNPEKKTVRCGLAKHYKNYGTSEPTVVEISSDECYLSIHEKMRGNYPTKSEVEQ